MVLMFVLFTFATQFAEAAEITRIWLTHKSNRPDKIVVNWMTDEPGESLVRFGLTADYEEEVRIEESTKIHHVEIPRVQRGSDYHYCVSTGEQQSVDATIKKYPTNILRVAVVANSNRNVLWQHLSFAVVKRFLWATIDCESTSEDTGFIGGRENTEGY